MLRVLAHSVRAALVRSAHTARRPNSPRVAPIARPPRNAPAPSLYVDTQLRAALVGRPNVGKSTLFNRLAAAVRGRGNDGRHNPAPLVFVRSVVDATPGITRDPRPAAGALSDLLFTVVDTPGLEDAVAGGAMVEVTEKEVGRRGNNGEEVSLVGASAMDTDPLYRDMYGKMEAATVSTMEGADVIFFVIDAAEGVTQIDRALAHWVRATAGEKHVILIANKCDLSESEANAIQSFELGLGDPIVLSAEHGLGFADLYSAINGLHTRRQEELRKAPVLPNDTTSLGNADVAPEKVGASDGLNDAFEDELVLGFTQKEEQPLHQLVVSIVGRPNVGKSTLLNRLVGSNESVVGPVAGVTRDAVMCEWKPPPKTKRIDSIPVWLIDTAGIRSRVKVEEGKVERLCVLSSLRALRHSHVIVVLLDSADPLCKQDLKLLDVVITEGRAVVLAVNKMDKIARDALAEFRLTLRYDFDHKVSDLAGAEVVELSAKEWHDGEEQSRRLFEAVERARGRWEKRISTSALNRFVTRFNERLSVGTLQGERRNRIGITKFITQKKIRPPMFRLDGSSAVSLNYTRALSNAIRKEFGFEGVPIRVKRPSRRKRK